MLPASFPLSISLQKTSVKAPLFEGTDETQFSGWWRGGRANLLKALLEKSHR